MKQKGFTLIELLVVVAIIGILAAIGVNNFGGFTEKAKIAAVKSNLKLVTKFVSVELMNCIISDKIKTWSFSTGYNGSPPFTVVERDCDNGANRFAQNAGYAFTVFSEDIDSYPNPFNAKDNNGGFKWDWDPPEPEHIGRVTCGKKDAWNYVQCHGRWGAGTNDYVTTRIDNPF